MTLEKQSTPRGKKKKKINQRFPSSHYRLAFTASEPLSYKVCREAPGAAEFVL